MQIKIGLIGCVVAALFGFRSYGLPVLGIYGGYAAADERRKEISINIRTIKASDPKTSVSHGIDVDSRLEDLRAKLAHLNFRTFKMISVDEVSLPLKKKGSVELSERTFLTLRPLYYDAERIGIWLKWTDKSGEQVLLDTRMHFTAGESMLTGTDSSGDCGLILAIQAAPEMSALQSESSNSLP
ncbi:MAG: hypothetical protein J5J00_03245 [Deltaproteobacteria bacterium]|nr:hypothetical protein [Deltaproteobacteria bacterium]